MTYRRLIPLLLLAVLMAGCRLPLSPDLKHQGASVTEFNMTLDYQVWLPDGYDSEPERTYPVLVWFHGGGENEYGWGRQGRIGEIVNKRVRRNELQPFIVVSPSAGAFRPIMRTYELLLRDHVLPEVRKKYRANDVTVAFGHSMGGLSALMVALRNPGLFKAVVAASPFVFDTTPWDTPEQKQAYEEKYGDGFLQQYRYQIKTEFNSREQYDQWAPFSLIRTMDSPPGFELLLTVGEQDPLGLFTHVSHLHEVMLEHNLAHEWRVQNDVGHGTVEDPYLMDWLNERAYE